MSISSARKTARGRRTEIHVTQEREETAVMCVEQRRVGMRLFPSLLRADVTAAGIGLALESVALSGR